MFVDKLPDLTRAQQLRHLTAQMVQYGTVGQRFTRIRRQETPFRGYAKICKRQGLECGGSHSGSLPTLYHSITRLQSVSKTKRPPSQAAFSSPLQMRRGCSRTARALSHAPKRIEMRFLTSASTAPIRMLKMASQLGRRELGDRSVPLRYVAGRRATENDAGGHFQHPVMCPFPRMPNTSSVPPSAGRSPLPCLPV